jgi:(4-(4-[2-(gamma-L-glutamylamino)ethyl]phenoxymethyl)furan-2-yl)methanamine synthase
VIDQFATGQALNVMNEFFATSADVYRLTGELPADHDQHPAADNGAKDIAATQARLARMIGLDARDGSANEWWAFAGAWRAQQVAHLRGQLERAIASHLMPVDATIVSAGCGDFLVPELAPPGWRCLHYGRDIARIAPDAAPGTQEWAQICAPSVAVAALFELEPA